MKTDELREKYLAFFETKGHSRCPSDVLVPTWDPSVLFTPAGMNQFKDHFLGKIKLEFTRATSCQKCLRTGDIDNVGRTAYHHTFFEMLGNFSFGDYFKRDAILWAWEFLTEQKWLGISPERLSVTVYLDDDEAANIWGQDVGLPSKKIRRMDEDENFWPVSAPSQGPDGVCGPCSEIYYHGDQGNEVEIWNLVFTQFNRVGQPPDNLRPLPSKNIDTGMGLERTAAVLQGVDSNYHIDILKPIVEAAGEVCGIPYEPATENGRRLRRITDHVRASSFAVHENVYPGPNQAKYVVRRLLRRAVLDGHQIGMREPFLHNIVQVVADAMHTAYPELNETVDRVRGVIRAEEDSFFRTIDAGLERIQRVFSEMKNHGHVRVDGEVAAEMYQTYGVPPELFQTLASEKFFTFDWESFNDAMKRHGEKSGSGQRELFQQGPIESLKKSLHVTQFLGYKTLVSNARIKGIVIGKEPNERLCEQTTETGENHSIRVVLDQSPFYGESGGQIGDAGTISSDDFEFEVMDTQKEGDLIIHIGHLLRGKMQEGSKVTAQVNSTRRQAIRRAHSATHILHYALQKHLGNHAQQQGSKVDEDWLRFDFTNMEPVDDALLETIESDVQERVAATESIQWKVLPLAEARNSGAMMLFGEKYPDPVRMVSMGSFSKELCGGTHLDSTDEVQAFEISNEEGVSAGTRRIVAITGAKAREHAKKTTTAIAEAAQQLDIPSTNLLEAATALAQTVRGLKKQLAGGGRPPSDKSAKAQQISQRNSTTEKMQEQFSKRTLQNVARVLNVAIFDVPNRIQALQKEVKTLEAKLAKNSGAGPISADSLLEQATEIAGTQLIVVETPTANANVMRGLIDQIRKTASPVAVLLASRAEGKVTLVAGVSRDLVARGLSAGDWIRDAATVVGGGGGGKPDMAQAGGKDTEKLPDALEAARKKMATHLQE